MTDLKLINGDLSINPSSLDLDYYLKEEDNISNSLIRRVKTLKSQYLLSYYDYTSLTHRVIDIDYGSDIYKYLSYPLDLVQTKAYNDLQESLHKETRVNIGRVSLVKENNYSLSFSVEYRYENNNYSVSG